MAYSVMIIDDDASVRERLKSMIAWSDLSANLVCEAVDSDTAQEFYMVYRPQIIITDINIPIISGLELARILQKDDPELRFIIITGYNDFELARQSVDLKATSLLSKPIQAQQINNSLAMAISSIKEEKARKAAFLSLEQLVENNLPQMQETYLLSLLRKKPASPELISQRISQLKISLCGPFYLVTVMSVRVSSSNMDTQDAAILLLRDKVVQRLTAEGMSLYAYLDDHFRLICIVSSADESCDNIIERVTLELHEELYSLEEAKLYVGIGEIVQDISALSVSFSGALAALNYRSLLGNDHISYYKNLAKMESSVPISEPILGRLRKKFRVGDTAALEQSIQEHVNFLLQQDGKEKLLRKFFYEYITAIINEAMHMGLEMSQMECCASLLSQLFQKANIEECTNDVINLGENLLRKIQSQKMDNFNYLISMSKEYIQNNLGNKLLSLDHVSNHVGLSKNYFCMLFHQFVGISFSNYLKQERFNMAKKLLVTTNLRIFEISDVCGFSNTKYFSYAFKQAFGKTPVEYQKEHIR